MSRRYTVKQFKELLAQGGELAENDLVLRAAPTVVTRDVDLEGNQLDRVLTFTISTPDVDRDGDTIAVDGWDISSFIKGGTVLWGHDYDKPVATPIATWVEGSALKSRAQFMPEDMNPFAFMVYRMVNEGYVRSASVGFKPLKYSENEERPGFRPLDFERQELLEWSVVPVPSNPNALAEARSKGIDLNPLGGWLESVLDEGSESQAIIARPKAEKLWQIVRDVTQVQVPEPLSELEVLKARNAALEAELEALKANPDEEPNAVKDQSDSDDESPELDLMKIIGEDEPEEKDSVESEVSAEDALSALRECLSEVVKESIRYHSGAID